MATKDLAVERAFQAQQAQLTGEVHPTEEAVMRRYKELKGWRIFWKEYMFHLVKRCSPQRICDFGCGEGASAVELAACGYQVVGVDLSPDLIKKAQRRAELDKVADRAQFVVANAEEEVLPAESFDLVFVQAVLHHMDVEAGLNSVLRLVKPGGYAIIQEPVAFSTSLQWLKDQVPIQKDLSPNERPLNHTDLKLIGEKFAIRQRHYFQCFYRVHRLLPARLPLRGRFLKCLLWLDYFVMNVLCLRHFAGVGVFLCQKPLQNKKPASS